MKLRVHQVLNLFGLIGIKSFFYLLMAPVFGLLISCQPTNTKVGRSLSKETGSTAPSATTTPSTSSLQKLKITDSSGSPLVGTETTLTIGQNLQLKAAIYTLDDTFVKDVSVNWTLKSISGLISNGLSCDTETTSTCEFTPTAPGKIYLEAILLSQTENLVSYVATTHPIVVTAPTVITSLDIVSGQSQNALVDSQLTLPLSVKVKDSFGQGVAGVAVAFTVSTGGGSILTSQPVVTDNQGMASAQVKLGTSTGSHAYIATVVSQSSLTQTFTATGFPAALATLEWLTPPLATYAHLPFSQQPAVVAKDSFGNLVTTLNSPLIVTVGTGNGTLTGSTSKNFINGSVTFTDLAYSMAESNVVLRVTSGTIQLNSSPLNFTSPSGVVAITPADVDFGYAVTNLAGLLGRSTSSIVTVGSLSQPMSVSVSGSGNPTLRLNGGSEQGSLSNVINGDTLQVVADAPSVHGSSNVIQVFMGGRTETFEVRFADPNSVAYVFVTNVGLNGAYTNDNTCTQAANAAGYSNSWIALIATSTTPLKNKMPFQWGKLSRLDGVPVANNWNSLWTGPLLNPINKDQNGSTLNNNVFTGVTDFATTSSSTGFSCNNWTSGLNVHTGQTGLSSATDSTWLNIINAPCDSSTKSVYCVSDPTGPQDTTPSTVTFTEMITTTATQRMTSAAVTVSGVSTLISISISGANGNPKLKINNGSEVTSGTIGNGDQVQLVMSAPTVIGQKNTATLTLGSSTFDWWVGLADSQKIAAVFVTSTDHLGTLGNVSGANATCNTLAAVQGYTGDWKALLTTDQLRAQDNIPWNWAQLRRLDGATVATSWSDFWDGTIQNPINITETLAIKNTAVWFGGSTGVGSNCTNFTDINPSGSIVDSTLLNWMSTTDGAACFTSRSLYCVSDPSGAADTTPNPISMPMLVSYVSGATMEFTEATVLGITSPINVVLTGTLGSPVLKINGVDTIGNSGTVNMGDKIKVTLTAPTTLGSQHTNTLQLGPDFYTLKIGYADSSKVARVFVSSSVIPTAFGIANIDNNCTSLAEASGLGGSWKAIASTELINATDHISWDWGTLKLVDNSTVVATSWSDLWDGAIAHPIDMDEKGQSGVSNFVATGTKSDGTRAVGSTAVSWTSTCGMKSGSSSLANSSWINLQSTGCNNMQFYCIEDTSATPDLMPSQLIFPYKIFQETSASITSATFTVKGITTSASFSLTDLSPGGIGNATYSINGGAAQPAGTPGLVSNGDGITITMMSPATLNSSHKATMSIGTSGPIPWRVWTKGVASGTTIKRFFVTLSLQNPSTLGGVVGADNACQTAATNKSLGGTWKALFSGESTVNTEDQWAINRIGYQWTELWTMNAAGVATQKLLTAPNIWDNSTLESLPNIDENGSAKIDGSYALTNTNQYGFGAQSGADSCYNFTGGGDPPTSMIGNIGGLMTDSKWLLDLGGTHTICYYSMYRLYCVEQ